MKPARKEEAANEKTESTRFRAWMIAAAKLFISATTGILLYVAHAAFIPIFLALLLALILSGPVELLHNRRVPRSASAVLILLIALSLIGIVAGVMWKPVQGWYAHAPQIIAAIRGKVRPIENLMNKIEEFRSKADISAIKHVGTQPLPVIPQNSSTLILDTSGAAIAGTLTFVIVTLFLLSGGPPMLARLTAAFADNLNASHVLCLIEKVRAEVGQFYLTTTLINFGLGTATSLAMWAWGMPTPYLWGILAAVLNYIPYAGSATTLVVTTLVAVVAFDDLGHVVGVAATYLTLATVEGQLVQPLLVGRRLEINPLIIFLALWFGGSFWGIPGILLATPILVSIKVVAENSRHSKAVCDFLGPNEDTSKSAKRIQNLSNRLRRSK